MFRTTDSWCHCQRWASCHSPLMLPATLHHSVAGQEETDTHESWNVLAATGFCTAISLAIPGKSAKVITVTGAVGSGFVCYIIPVSTSEFHSSQSHAASALLAACLARMLD